MPLQGATAPTRDTQGVASLALGYVLHWAFSPPLLNPKLEFFLSLHKIQIPMNLFVFIAIYILPSMLLAGIFAPKLGKLIQRLIEYLLNKISK